MSRPNHSDHPPSGGRRYPTQRPERRGLPARHPLLHTLVQQSTLATLLTFTIFMIGVPQYLTAQEVVGTIQPDTIRVGDLFYATLRLQLPRGATLAAPDTIALDGELENAGPLRRSTRELPDGGAEITLTYPITAWRPGDLDLPVIRLQIIEPDGETRAIKATLPKVQVISILPPDTTALEPRPLKDVIGPGRLIWPWIAGALSLAAALATIVYLRRTRRALAAQLTFDVALVASPKERALAALDGIHALGLPEDGRLKEFYSRSTAVLREFLEEYDTSWGTELTTTELREVSSERMTAGAAAELQEILGSADQVKFNRVTPTPAEAYDEWRVIRAWILGFEFRGPRP